MSEHSLWRVPVTLTGSALRLVPLRLSDASDFLGALGGPDEAAVLLHYLSYYPPRDLEQTRAIILAALTDPDRIPYGQRLIETGELVGTTSFYEINEPLRSLAIGHTWIGRRFWRSGVNRESKLIMLGRAFDELGAERVVWHTDIRNERSQQAIARLGATREGVLRHHRIRRDGSWRDTVQYSMLRAEWPDVKDRLTAGILRG
jgi:RimJ/RimL family protein N-acetyltransferase